MEKQKQAVDYIKGFGEIKGIEEIKGMSPQKLESS
jgi:hypothetical protein